MPVAAISHSHRIRFFFPGVDALFVVGDKMVRIEHSRVESKVVVCRLGRNVDGGWLWNFEHDENR